MSSEILTFKFNFTSVMWDQPPFVKIKINEKLYFDDKITAVDLKKPKTIKITNNFDYGALHEITIHRTNKRLDQTILDTNGQIIKDQLLIIQSIEVNDIEIKPIIYNSTFTPYYQEPWYTQQVQSGNTPPSILKKQTILGFDGIWKLCFSCPFNIWILDSIIPL